MQLGINVPSASTYMGFYHVCAHQCTPICKYMYYMNLLPLLQLSPASLLNNIRGLWVPYNNQKGRLMDHPAHHTELLCYSPYLFTL